MNKGIWQPFIDLCARKCNNTIALSAIDLPGAGMSPISPDSSYIIEDVSAAVARQLKPNTVLIGWSMGGLIAQYIADCEHPNLLAHVQIASSPKFVQSNNWAGIKPEVLQLFADQINTNHLALLKRFIAIQCLGLDDPKETMKIMLNAVNQYPLSSIDTLVKSLSLLRETDLRPCSDTLKNGELPCLRIFGAHDGLVPKKAIQNILCLYPHSKTVTLPKASHAPFISHPEQCLRAIIDFLAAL